MRSVKSAERALAVFELFSKMQSPLTVGHVSKELSIPQPSASVLLHNLTGLGYLEHDAVRHTFIPGIRIVLLGSWIEQRFGETRSLSRHLNTLFKRVNETAYIAVQNGPFVQYVLAQMAERPNKLFVRSGQFRSLTNTAAGRALLSVKSDKEIASWLKRCNATALPAANPPRPPGDFPSSSPQSRPTKKADLLKAIENARSRGYAESAGDEIAGQGGFAITFPFPHGATQFAVGAGGPIERVQKKRSLILDALFDFRRNFED